MSRRHRGMGGEYRRTRYDFPRRFEADAETLHDLPKPFQSHESAVPFVHVADRWLDAQGIQCPHAANP